MRLKIRIAVGDFPDHPVVKTPSFHCRGHGFYPWLGNLRSHLPQMWPKTTKKTLGLISSAASRSAKHTESHHLALVELSPVVGALASHEASYKVNGGIAVGVKSPTADVL